MVITKKQFKQQNKAKFSCKYAIPRGTGFKAILFISPIILKVRSFKL